jgi:hypothetical protein
MDAEKIFLGIALLFILLCLSGCTEQEGVKTQESFDNIEFDSDVVMLDAANLRFIKDEEEFDARSVELKYKLHNPLNRYVTVSVDVMFMDELGREIYSEKDYMINLPSEYTEGSLNTVSYSGSMVNAIHIAKITAFEIED